VSAGQHQYVRVGGSLCDRFLEIDTRHLFGHGMVDPPFFHQRNEQGARFFVGFHSVALQCPEIGMTAHRGLGGNDDGRATLAQLGGYGRARFHDANYRNRRRALDGRQGQRGGSIAGNNQQVDALGLEKPGCTDGIAGDGFRRLATVRKPGRISKVKIVCPQPRGHGTQHGQAADTRVKNSYAGNCHRPSFMTCPIPLAR